MYFKPTGYQGCRIFNLIKKNEVKPEFPIFANFVSVVQWIEFWFPVPTMGVRIPSGTQIKLIAFKLV